LQDFSNTSKWAQDEGLQQWLFNSRLNFFGDLPKNEDARDLAIQQLVEIGAAVPGALENLQRLVSLANSRFKQPLVAEIGHDNVLPSDIS
jgi:hypothetical protein